MTPFLETCLAIALGLLVLSLILATFRVLTGPAQGDRIVAIDLFGVLAVALIALFALWMEQVVFLDAAIALALVAFFGTVAYARFVEQKAARQRKEDVDA